MAKTIQDGYDELTVSVSKTVQEAPYEPLKMDAKLKRIVKPNEISSEMQEITEILENEIADYFGLEKR